MAARWSGLLRRRLGRRRTSSRPDRRSAPGGDRRGLILEVLPGVSSPWVAPCRCAVCARGGRLAGRHPPRPARPGPARGHPDRPRNQGRPRPASRRRHRGPHPGGAAAPGRPARRGRAHPPAFRVIGRTAQLAFHPVLGVAEPAGEEPATTRPPADADALVLADEDGARLRLGPAALTGEAVGDARAELDPQFQARWQVAIEFQGVGSRRWAELTRRAACEPPGDPKRRVAIVLDCQVISSPQVDPSVICEQGITGGQTVITGDFSDREAEDLSLLIRAGALPVPVEVVEQRTVGPTLGEAAIKASVQAAIAGAALTMLFMIAYYRLLGGLAAVALLCYGLLSFAVLLALRATLTLPGIAGFVLAIGMAV